MRTHPCVAVAAAAAVLAGTLLTGCSSTTSTPATGTSTTGTSATSTPATSVPATSTPSSVTPTASPAGLVPLWPFTTPAQVATWQSAFRSAAESPWHLDVERTALDFTRAHLRYTEVDRVTTRSVSGADARIGVGWNDDNGTARTVGVLHLVRFGTGDDAPWVVVGSEDTQLTLTTPRYGATITSPLTVGGTITGVDESLHVTVLGPTSAVPLAEVLGLPAGGENTPWTATLTFAPPPGTVLTVAVSTGGHLRSVERFAVTAVRTA